MSGANPWPRLNWPNRAAPLVPDPVRLRTLRRGDSSALLVHGDNLAGMHALKSKLAARVTLAYLDPPFFTNREHLRVARSRDPKTGAMSRSHSPAFDDRWIGLHHYLQALLDRISVARDLLADNGCLIVHVDSKTSHYVKIVCDELFGVECFASEIVWRYRRWPSKTRNFQRMHDVLLRYVKNPEATPRFRQLYEPLAESTRRTWGTNKQRAIVDDSGRRTRSSTTAETTPGTPLGDVWEIGIVAPVARERTGYPTQKPEALLERLLEACTEPGDLVLDPYAGSGTTLAVARRLGRRAVGIDCGAEALAIARDRLSALGRAPMEQRLVRARKARGKPKKAVDLALGRRRVA